MFPLRPVLCLDLVWSEWSASKVWLLLVGPAPTVQEVSLPFSAHLTWLISVGLNRSHTAAAALGCGPALTHTHPDDAPNTLGMLQTERRSLGTVCVFFRTPGQMELTLHWLFSIPWRRITYSLSIRLPITVAMDVYASTLSPALDIGTGCYLLIISKLNAARKLE